MDLFGGVDNAVRSHNCLCGSGFSWFVDCPELWRLVCFRTGGLVIGRRGGELYRWLVAVVAQGSDRGARHPERAAGSHPPLVLRQGG
jgi:hypothetical protein